MRNIARYRSVLHSSAADHDHTGHLITMPGGFAWHSAGAGPEWVAVDLGVTSDIEKVSVCWGADCALRYDVLLSAEGVRWELAAECRGKPETNVETPLSGSARYLKILCRACSGARYVIRQLEVWGDNDLRYALPPLPAPGEDGTQVLTGGSWRLCRAEEVRADGISLSSSGYDDSAWLPATVPGTILVSYLNAGSIPDPNYDDWQFQISDSYFTADFWYRDRFTVPRDRRGQRVFLDFGAVNWKADVYFNGTYLKNPVTDRRSSIEGAFMRARFDVTGLVNFGGGNFLAVLIHRNANPGKVTTQGLAFGPGNNGGALGADNPTLHASVGWDWLPTIRGRNIGIYGPVSLSFGGDAELVDPWIQPELRLAGESAAIPAEDLMRGDRVRIEGWDPGRIWTGREGDGFTVDLGEPVTLGSVTLVWGSEAGVAAADLGSRHPASFLLESSADGERWSPIDAYPGGTVELEWFGKRSAAPNPGSAAFEGHTGRDSVQGATALVPLDLSMFGRGEEIRPVFSPQRVRYLRFTVLRRRELGGAPVDTRLAELMVYRESPVQVEQGKQHDYLLDTSQATLIFRAEIRSRSRRPVLAELRGRIMPGEIPFETKVRLGPGETAPVELRIPLARPRLWWPNTYGEPFLYTAEAELRADGQRSDSKRFRFGVRRFDTPVDGGVLSLYCNGVRILAKGGNWGMDDGLKRDTARTLRDKVRLHAEAGLTMIRNWVGMTNHPGFYDACDEYGILIWDDFWLANPVDGPEPEDPELFLMNAEDKIRRVRSHPSLAFYCGRNEGEPNRELNEGLVGLTSRLDGTRIYFPNSAALPVGSGGGYSLAAPGGDRGIKQYFNDVSSVVLRSERGIPNIPALESARRFLKPEHVWPINEVWALHDLTFHMNGPANTYISAVQRYLGGEVHVPEDRIRESEPRDEDPAYRQYKREIAAMCGEAGKAWSAEAFFGAAQLINYDHHRGMFEALATRRSAGLLMWMSQSSWPSFMWQTYDYYLDTNGGYFGLKAGNQPVRAVFDPRDDTILAANASAVRYERLTVEAELYDLTGRRAAVRTYDLPVLEADAVDVRLGKADFSPAETDVVFLRLTLRQASGEALGVNTYCHNRREYQDYRALMTMGQAAVYAEVLSCACSGGEILWTLQVENGPVPALGVRLRLTGSGGEAILPVFYSDNYLMLMPGERRTVTASVHADRVKGEPVWTLTGWNVGSRTIHRRKA